MNYYNDNDPLACAWLRELIAGGIIPQGDVDGRSIEDVSADELSEYTQCHFFAGVGGWPIALAIITDQARHSGQNSSLSHVSTENRGALNPDLSRWLMGYPAEHLSQGLRQCNRTAGGSRIYKSLHELKVTK